MSTEIIPVIQLITQPYESGDESRVANSTDFGLRDDPPAPAREGHGSHGETMIAVCIDWNIGSTWGLATVNLQPIFGGFGIHAESPQ